MKSYLKAFLSQTFKVSKQNVTVHVPKIILYHKLDKKHRHFI